MKTIIIPLLVIMIEITLCDCSNKRIKTPVISINLEATLGINSNFNQASFKEETIEVIGGDSISIKSCIKLLLTSKYFILFDEATQRIWFVNFNGIISHWIDYSNIENNYNSNIFDICVVGRDSLALFDIGSRRIILFNGEGKFLEQHNVPFNYGNFESLTKDVYFFSLGRAKSKLSDSEYRQFCIYDVNNNKMVDSFLPFSTSFKNWASYRKDIAKDGDQLVCITSFNNTIFSLTNNSFKPVLSLDLGDNNIDTAGIAQCDRVEKVKFGRLYRNVVWSLGEVFLDDHFVYLWTILNKMGYFIEIDLNDYTHKVVRGLSNSLFGESTNFLLPKPQYIKDGIAYGIIFPKNLKQIYKRNFESVEDSTADNPVIIKYKIRDN